MLEKLSYFQAQKAKIELYRRLFILFLILSAIHEFLRFSRLLSPAPLVLFIFLASLFWILWKHGREKEDVESAAFEIDGRGKRPDLFPTVLELERQSDVHISKELQDLAHHEYGRRVGPGDICNFKDHGWKTTSAALLLLLLLFLPFLMSFFSSSNLEDLSRGQGTRQQQSQGHFGGGQESADGTTGDGQEGGKDTGTEAKGENGEQQKAKDGNKSGKEADQPGANQESGASEKQGDSPENPLEIKGTESPGAGEQKQAIKPVEKSLENQKPATSKEEEVSKLENSKKPPKPPPSQSKENELERKQAEAPDLEKAKLKADEKAGEYDPKKDGVGGDGSFDWSRVQGETIRNQEYQKGRDQMERFLANPRVPDAYKESLIRLMNSVEPGEDP